MSERKGLVTEKKSRQRETLADAHGVPPPLPSPVLRDKDGGPVIPGG